MNPLFSPPRGKLDYELIQLGGDLQLLSGGSLSLEKKVCCRF